MERQFLIAVPFIFPFTLIILYMAVIYITSILTVRHFQPLFCWNLILVLSILPKNKYLKRKEDIIELLEVTVKEGYLM